MNSAKKIKGKKAYKKKTVIKLLRPKNDIILKGFLFVLSVGLVVRQWHSARIVLLPINYMLIIYCVFLRSLFPSSIKPLWSFGREFPAQQGAGIAQFGCWLSCTKMLPPRPLPWLQKKDTYDLYKDSWSIQKLGRPLTQNPLNHSDRQQWIVLPWVSYQWEPRPNIYLAPYYSFCHIYLTFLRSYIYI